MEFAFVVGCHAPMSSDMLGEGRKMAVEHQPANIAGEKTDTAALWDLNGSVSRAAIELLCFLFGGSVAPFDTHAVLHGKAKIYVSFLIFANERKKNSRHRMEKLEGCQTNEKEDIWLIYLSGDEHDLYQRGC